tara:strand:+ start:366 stop:632 length:267 start_codon:yes stop_codon:yes gene_type:complete
MKEDCSCSKCNGEPEQEIITSIEDSYIIRVERETRRVGILDDYDLFNWNIPCELCSGSVLESSCLRRSSRNCLLETTDYPDGSVAHTF